MVDKTRYLCESRCGGYLLQIAGNLFEGDGIVSHVCENGCKRTIRLCTEEEIKAYNRCDGDGRRRVFPRRRFEILRRDGYRCKLCGISADEGARLEVDHIIPIARNGSNHPDNLWALCRICNVGKGTLAV